MPYTAAARPVVCSLVEGSEELVSHASQWQGFAPGDSPHMASLIEHLESDQTLCNEIGMLNHERVQKHFSLTTMTEAYRAHYRTLLTRRLDVS